MLKINEVAIRKNQQIVGLKIFQLRFITTYFADIKFPKKDSVTTQAFLFSRFKKKIPKLSS